MTKPNLFNFATSELSQDAFICWILDHANPNHSDIDPQLRNVAISIINRFLELANEPHLTLPIDAENFKVIPQFKNIDVLLIVNQYAIVIEDKTNTNVHSDQLNKYIQAIKNSEYKDQTSIQIFFKTYDQSNYKNIIKDQFHLFLRKDILEIFHQYPNIDNDIYQDFYQRIQKLENDVEAYKTTAMSKWSNRQWTGFFKNIQTRLNTDNIHSNWTFGNHLGRPFSVLFWCWKGNDGAQQYLQLEQWQDTIFRLSIRIAPSTKYLQNKCIMQLQEAYKTSQFKYIEVIHKTKGIREGKSAIIMNIVPKFKIEEGDILNIDDMYNFLKEANEFLSQHYWKEN